MVLRPPKADTDTSLISFSVVFCALPSQDCNAKARIKSVVSFPMRCIGLNIFFPEREKPCKAESLLYMEHKATPCAVNVISFFILFPFLVYPTRLAFFYFAYSNFIFNFSQIDEVKITLLYGNRFFYFIFCYECN